MNLITKALVPAVLAVAAFSAQAAGSGQIPDYGNEVQASVTGGAVAGAAVSITSFRGQEATSLTVESSTMRTRDEVRSEISKTKVRNADYIA